MLWSLIKILLFIAIVAGLALGAGWLMEAGTGIRLTIGSTEYTLGPLQAVIAALLLVLLIWIVLKLTGLLIAVLKFLNGDETAISRYLDRNRERKGYQALADGMLALASGEGRTALLKANKARRLLQKPEITNLLLAQAAEMAGDRQKALEVYKDLLKDEKTRFVGIRGLLKQKLDEGDTDTALLLARKAFALKPRQQEIHDTLLKLQAEKGDWSGARETLAAKLKAGALPRDVYKRRDAVLALSQARDILAEGKSIEAREEAIEANRLSPDLVPAAVLAARSYIEAGKPRLATRILKKAWSVNPHPDLAAAFAEIRPDETPEERLKRFRTLTRINPDHPETKMLLAELNLAAGKYPEARAALGDLPEKEPNARVLTLLAAIERGQGSDDAVVRAWLAKALAAPRGPQWVCEKCQTVHSEWAPICTNCGSFDTLSWRQPDETAQGLPGAAEMLPLLVGSEETTGESEEAAAETEEAGGGAAKEGADHPDEGAATQETESTKGDPPVLEGEVVALGGEQQKEK